MPNAAKKSETLLNVGDVAPDCVLPGTGGKQISLADYKGRKKVVLYFYPKDDTPGCTTESKDFRDLTAQFVKANTIVIGVSKDSIESHEKFKKKYDLDFGLASDAKTDVAERYGVWGEKSMYGKKYMGMIRSTFLIDREGNIAQCWHKVSVTGHAAEVLKAAEALN